MKKEFYGHANKGGVYKITNLENKKIYIGSAKRFRERATGHASSLKKGRHKNKHLQASWNKWGEDAFVFEVIEIVDGDKGERFKVEKKYIDNLIKEGKWKDTFNFKKKVIQKERSCFSKSPKETKKLISQNSKKYWSDPKHRNQRSKEMKQRWKDKEYKAKVGKRISKSLTGKKLSKEHVENMANALRGRKKGPHTKEARLKMGKNRKNCKKIKVTDKMSGKIAIYYSQSEAARKLGISVQSVANAINGVFTSGYKTSNYLFELL